MLKLCIQVICKSFLRFGQMFFSVSLLPFVVTLELQQLSTRKQNRLIICVLIYLSSFASANGLNALFLIISLFLVYSCSLVPWWLVLVFLRTSSYAIMSSFLSISPAICNRPAQETVHYSEPLWWKEKRPEYFPE